MSDLLQTLVEGVKKKVAEGYYNNSFHSRRKHRSLKTSILNSRNVAIISEIKFSSPSSGIIRNQGNVSYIARQIESGGAIGISVLTEPDHFHGSLEYLVEAKSCVEIPVLMKDFVIDPLQIDSASRCGADCILLISSIFRRGLSEYKLSEMIDYAHRSGLEVLLETHSKDEFEEALSSEADLVGINNRDLSTLNIDISNTEKIMKSFRVDDRVVVSESGIDSPETVVRLRKSGVRAFLIGASIMKSRNIVKKLKSFMEAY